MKKMHKPISPWSMEFRFRMLLWELCWASFCQWTPKPLNGWRLLWLRLFGAKIFGRPFVHQRARIQIPWHVEMHDGACVGDRTNLYSLDWIVLEEGCLVAQEAYLSTGDHDLNVPGKPLVTQSIRIGKNAFVGARAFVCMGVTIGENAVVGACAVVTKDVVAGTTVVGSPARVVGA